MTRWLEIAWHDAGVAEIPGHAADDTILGYFQEVGRDDITSDEVSWCAAFVGACLAKAGVAVDLPHGKRLLARAYLDVGTPIEQPRVGAVAIFTRGDPNGWTGHVFFVTGWTASHIKGIGGNQRNSVCEISIPRSQLIGLRWPEKVEPKVLARTSRIASGAGETQKDGIKATGTQGLEMAIPAPPQKLGLEEIAANAGSFKGSVETLEQFLLFVWGKGGWIALALTAYWGARIVWRSGWIRTWRAQDQSEGKTT